MGNETGVEARGECPITPPGAESTSGGDSLAEGTQPGATEARTARPPVGPEPQCDLVMKGGVTSGVIYPLAICELAKTYRFRSIGGASAGAIAAAAAAAAEYGRQVSGGVEGAGFEGLAQLPHAISAPVDETGRSRLLSLFQPSEETSTLFEVFLRAIDARPMTMKRRIGGVVWFLVRRHPLFPRLALVLAGLAVAGVALAGNALATVAVVATALCTLVIGCLLAGVVAVRRGLAGLTANGAGLCSGFTPEGAARPEKEPPLCEWLNDLFNGLAGKPSDQPLTMGDLEGVGVELAMITTNLTHGRPYRLPFEEETFFFRKSEMARLFPARVVEVMVCAGEALIKGLKNALVRTPQQERLLQVHDRHQRQVPDEFFPFPPEGDLPVVVATRLSLSFPILLSAVPLHQVDWTRQKAFDGQPELERCWFSDGGICSNLPIHFFDALLPTRPTFALNLEAPHPDRPLRKSTSHDRTSEKENVWMHEPQHDGGAEQWTRIGGTSGLAPGELLAAMVDTMQSWNDTMQSRVPGYRERIVHILRGPDEGGLNLSMPKEVIERLASRGGAAGKLAVERFAPSPGSGRPDGFQEHLWIRYRSAIVMLQELFTQSHKAYFVDDDVRDRLENLIRSNQGRLLSAEQLELIQHLNDEFAERGATLGLKKIGFVGIAPSPRPELRARPRGA